MNTCPFLFVVTSVLLFLSSSFITAGTKPDKTPHVLIMADQSGSMHSSGRMYMQTQAIIKAVEGYFTHCSKLDVTYIAWGGTVEDPEYFHLHDKTSRDAFVALLDRTLSRKNLTHTKHDKAFEAAVTYAAGVESPFIMIVFITDESGSVSVQASLPANTHLTKISMGLVSAKTYLRDSFMPGVGRHHHVRNSGSLA